MNKPKFRLVSDGKHSYFEVCGKSMGKGVSSVSYIHKAGKNPEVSISFDLHDFDFMEDGKVDMVTCGKNDTFEQNQLPPWLG